MGAAKTEHFSKRQNDIATLAKALGHPARVAIVEYLLDVDQCICGDIVDHLPLAQATVSQHLKALKEAGVIRGSIEGNAICYCLDERTIAKLRGFLEGVSKALRKKCC
ncbi:MAG: winged helix-turn-helix transcriptional regulator [Chloracidobacterium sp.]|nr:winged helix-turn-helix transcriptional regulator [Chloracidobacterium sp.]MCO5332402.1 metalloregulator ArsR/SmtB family transcription factor [Pyrinomonadaceae bacterium]